MEPTFIKMNFSARTMHLQAVSKSPWQLSVIFKPAWQLAPIEILFLIYGIPHF